jgi:adenylosuccinate lyase
MMSAVKKGGDRQELHEKLRQHSIAAAAQVKEEGKPNDLIERVVNDSSFGLTHADIDGVLVPEHFTGRSAQQVSEFLQDVIAPVLQAHPEATGLQAELSV